MTLLHCKCEGFILDMGVLNRLKSFPIFQLGHGYAFLLNFFHVYILYCLIQDNMEIYNLCP